MVNLSIGLNFARRFLGKSTQKTGQTVEVAVAKMQPKTKSLTDPVTGVVKGLEREITLNSGEKGLARIDYLGDGKRKITIFKENNNPYLWETKTITRKNGESVFGGNKIIIDKEKEEIPNSFKNIHLEKNYSKAGTLEHKELILQPYDYKASMDRVYAEHPLNSGYVDMTVPPSYTINAQHSLTIGGGVTENNYYKFGQKGTNYDNIIDTIKAAEEAKIAEAKAAKEVAIKAEREAAAKLEASRPKLNTSKLFNKNIDEFKCIEETKADGSIIRRYFDPYASNGKSNPMITTIDRGNYHEEIIYDPRKELKLSYRISRLAGEPEIEMMKGWQHRYTYKYDPQKGYSVLTQKYNDGQNFVELVGNKIKRMHIVARNSHYSPENRVKFREPEYIEYSFDGNLTSNESFERAEIGFRRNEILKEMFANKVNLLDLFKPYSK